VRGVAENGRGFDRMTQEKIESTAAGSMDSFMLEVADVVNATLDLETLLRRVAELVGRVIHYDIFAILLLHERDQELRIRFQIGHPPEVAQAIRVKVGTGITGLAAKRREAVLVRDVTKFEGYIPSGSGARSELAVPLINKNKVIGVIDLESSAQDHFTEEHRTVLTLIASRIAVAIENARLYTRVSRQAKSLALLNEISRDLTSILDLDELLKRVGEQLSRIIDYQMFGILLLDETRMKLQHRFSLRFNESINIKDDRVLGVGVVGYAALHNQAVLVPDVRKDPRYIALNPETRSELVVPLVYKEKLIGVLDLEHTKAGYFTDEHRRMMTTLAAQVAVAIENARLYEKIASQEKRMEQDLALAHELQYRLLPATCPVFKRSEVSAKFIPARAIGGDLYDFIPYSGHRTTAISVGDVSGKGAPAAIYAALVSGIMRSQAGKKPSPSVMLSAINVALAERPIEGQFVSMIYALWDDTTATLRVANSGLPRPLHCRKGTITRIEAIGLPLGLFATADYDEHVVLAEPGDLFVFFSDGILDASDANGQMFGGERLRQVITKNSARSAYDVVTAVFDAVGEFSAGVAAFDDQTVVALKVKEAAIRR
jgi:sigma-B regulation protein RsbU (phosphoserine phosphatase)